MTLAVAINLTIVTGLVIGLYRLGRAGLPLSRRVLIGMVAGAVVGLALQAIYSASPEVISETLIWSNVIGSGFVSLLRMIVMPLILVMMIAAVTRM